MARSGDELEADLDRFVDRIVEAGRFWIVINDEGFNTVREDPNADRDVQVVYASEEEAQAGADRPADAGKGLRPDSIPVADLPALCDAAEERGEAFALSIEGERFVVTEPDLLREEIQARLGGA